MRRRDGEVAESKDAGLMATTEILRVLVGSQAHGLADAKSDADYRGVFVIPTSELLRLGPKPVSTQWIEGDVDNTSYELSHFLFLATKSNPSILEVFKGDPLTGNNEHWIGIGWAGDSLLKLFPHVWSSVGVLDAFTGYGNNQRKKMLENKDGRMDKYAVAWLRTLYNAVCLLKQGDFSLSVVGTPIEGILRAWRAGRSENTSLALRPGEVINTCLEWDFKVRDAFAENPNKKTNVEAVNDYLLSVRKAFW